MERRKDRKTAEQIEMALLTRTAFDTQRAKQYALAVGVIPDLVEDVLRRPPAMTRAKDSVPVPHLGPLD